MKKNMTHPGHLYLRANGEVVLYLGRGKLVNADLTVTMQGYVFISWWRCVPSEWAQNPNVRQISQCRRWTCMNRDLRLVDGTLVCDNADSWRVKTTRRPSQAVLDLGPGVNLTQTPVVAVDSTHAWVTTLTPDVLLSDSTPRAETITGWLLCKQQPPRSTIKVKGVIDHAGQR